MFKSKRRRILEYQVAKIKQIYQEMSVQLEYTDLMEKRGEAENANSKAYAVAKALNHNVRYWRDRISDEVFRVTGGYEGGEKR